MPRFEGIKYYCDKEPELFEWNRAMDKIIAFCQGNRALDVGSGNVTLSPETKRADIAPYPGLDYQCDAAHLQDRNGVPLPNISFDFVFSSHCLEHTDNPLETLKEWCRVAQKYVVVIIPNGEIFKNTSIDELLAMGHKHNLYMENIWDMAQQLRDVALLQEMGYITIGRANIYFVLVKKNWG